MAKTFKRSTPKDKPLAPRKVNVPVDNCKCPLCEHLKTQGEK
jgi:hypothetical protein